MMAKSHAITGLAGWVVIAPLLHLPPFGPAGLLLALAGSLLPDIDHPASWVGRRARPVSTAIAAVFGHRGITHSAVAVAGLLMLAAHHGWPRAVTAPFVVGYGSHLLADLLSGAGLRLAWPLRPAWRLPVYSTGRASEAVVVAGICFGAGLLALHGADGHGLPHAIRFWLCRNLGPVRF